MNIIKTIVEGLVPTELTWDEKNPVNYIYRPCEAIFRLEARLKKRKQNITDGKQDFKFIILLFKLV